MMRSKISIIGCGAVGVRYAYALLLKGIAREIVIVDIDRKRLEGEVMDLSHTAPYVAASTVIAGDYPDLRDSKLVVITAGKKQRTGQTRLALLKENIAVFKQIVPRVAKYAPDATLLIASNPVDVLAYAAYKISSKPAHEVIGSGTVLDSARLRHLLSVHCGVDARNIHAYILGEHGDSEFAVWSKAMVGGVLFKDFCPFCVKSSACSQQEERERIFEQVRASAYRIIERKGETSYGIGLALARITRAILDDENAILPVSSYISDYLGITDIYLSLPAIVNQAGVRSVLAIDFSEDEKAMLRASAATVKKALSESGL